MRRTRLVVLLAAGTVLVAATAWAQPVSGLYMSGGLGVAFPHGRADTPPAAPTLAPAPVPSAPAVPGAAGQGSIGYGVGNGLRFEAEGFGGTSRLRLPQGP